MATSKSSTEMVVDIDTGEIVSMSLGPRESFYIPDNQDDLVSSASDSQTKIWGHSWRTAAMVYAWTYEGENQNDAERGGSKLSQRQFSKLGIRGIGSRNTVAKYRKAMQWAIDNGHCEEPVPGDSVALPTVDFPSVGGKDVVALKHTGDHESYTPAHWIEVARSVMGSIDVDPASNEMAQETVKANTYYTAYDDGLTKDWDGNVFLNPPYEHPLIEQFIDKLIEEYTSGDVKQAVLLTNNSADTKWFHAAAKASSAFCLTRGRINFMKRDGTTSSPTNGQCLFYFGDNRDEFVNFCKLHKDGPHLLVMVL